MDNRGYGESDKPKNQRDYSVDKLADDVANLAKHLGRDNFILVGHDWGGAIGYEESELIHVFALEHVGWPESQLKLLDKKKPRGVRIGQKTYWYRVSILLIRKVVLC